MLEVGDIVLGEHLQVIVDCLNVPIEMRGQLADARRALGNNALEEFDTTIGQECPEVTRILEISDVWDLFTGFPAVQPVKRVLAVRLP